MRYYHQKQNFAYFIPEWVTAAALTTVIAIVLVLSTELRGLYKIALLGGVGGGVFLVSYPKRRMALVCGWILLYPLSIEKVFFFGEPLADYFFQPSLVVSASDVMLICLAINLFWESIVRKKKKCFPPQSSSALIPYIVLCMWSFIVFFFRTPDTTSTLTIFHNVKMVLFLLIMTSSIRTPGELKLLLYTICAAVLIQVVIVNISFFTDSTISVSSKISSKLMSFSGTMDTIYVRATGTVGHVNQEACYLTFFGLPLIALLFSPHKRLKVVGILAVLGCATAIGFTFSRSAWLSVAFATFVIIVIGIWSKAIVFRHWIYAMPFLMIGIAILPVVSKPVLDRFIHGDDGATSSRIRAMKLAMDLFEKHPVTGVGSGNFTRSSLYYYPPEKKGASWLHPGEIEREMPNNYGRIEINHVRVNDKIYTVPLPVHNKYLLVLTELGIVGLAIFLWFQYRIYLHLKNCIKTKDKMIRWLGIGISGAFFASQCYMNLDLFSDDKTMEILLIIPVLALITDRIGKKYGLQQ